MSEAFPGPVTGHVPVLRLGDVLLVTLQGELHDSMAQQLQQDIAESIASSRVTGVLLDLSGVDIPLYVLDGRDTLIEATPFEATYKPCPSSRLPRSFTTGRRTGFCLVYLVPGRGALEAVSFRPTQKYDPITWDGKVRRLAADKKQGTS